MSAHQFQHAHELASSCKTSFAQKIARLFVALGLLSLLLTPTEATPLHRSAQLAAVSPWGLKSSGQVALEKLRIRGGSTVEEEDEEYDSEDEYDSDEEEDEDSESEEEDDDEVVEGDNDGGVEMEVSVEKYDELLMPNPMTNLYASLGVMMLGRKVDIFSPVVVRAARAAFISYLVFNQAFLLYARVKARSMNNRTPIELKNPLSSMLQSQLGDSMGSNGMVKNLASSFLSSKSTVMEYDIKQVQSMQSGVIINMCFMWFLHFKMGQVQPLIIQTVTGLSNLIYSPLFQIYVMGRNLERPFKSPATKGLGGPTEGDDSEEVDAAEEVVEENNDDSAAMEENDEGDSENEEEDSDEEEEDSDEDEDEESDAE